MANFSVRQIEGMRQVVIAIDNETVRARRGAMSNMQGAITLTPRLPGFGDLFRSMFTSEARIRPYYSGSGLIMLQPSLSGYHIMDVAEGERWILEPGAYWASDQTVRLGLTRERIWPSFWAGDGFLSWKTTASGSGKMAINAPGPVEIVQITEGEFSVQGRLVLGRTDGLRFSSRIPAKWPRHWISGQQRLRVHSGTGKLLVCTLPYWNQRLYRRMVDEDQDSQSLFH